MFPGWCAEESYVVQSLSPNKREASVEVCRSQLPGLLCLEQMRRWCPWNVPDRKLGSMVRINGLVGLLEATFFSHEQIHEQLDFFKDFHRLVENGHSIGWRLETLRSSGVLWPLAATIWAKKNCHQCLIRHVNTLGIQSPDLRTVVEPNWER